MTILKISSFVHVIGFGFIPNFRKIDNKVKEEERKRRHVWNETEADNTQERRVFSKSSLRPFFHGALQFVFQ